MIKKILCFFLFALGGLCVESEAVEVKSSQVVENVDIVEKWAKSDRDVRKQYNLFLQSVQEGQALGVLSQEDILRVLQGAAFAAEKHKLQVRRNAKQTPYIIHPIAVADHIMRVGKVYDADVVIAALLHDTINEGLATKEEIASIFGKKVAGYVEEMTDSQTISPLERKKMQIINAIHQSNGAAVIKLSDKWHNLNTLMKDPPAGWTQEKMDQYFQWAQAVVENLPDANPSLEESFHQTIIKYWEGQ